jgi:all-trans-retinol 13,14-reductase
VLVHHEIMSLYAAYKHAHIEGHFDAIVIGSGIGGLAVAGLLAKLAHKRVLVLERHYAIGGFTHTFTRPGYEWDVGVHYVGGVHDPASNERKWLEFLTEGRLDWASMGDVYDRFLIGSETYAFPAGRERWRETLKVRFPHDAKAIDAYLAATAASTKWMGLYFAEKALPPALGGVAGRLMRAPFLRRGGHTTLEVLRGITNNLELIGVLAGQWGDYGLPPSQSSFAAHAAIAEHYFNGAAYPVGGAGQIAAALLPPIEREGGQVISAADVQRVLTPDGNAIGVGMADGRELLADLVISDAGAITTYGRLLEGQPAAAKVLSEIRRLQRSPGYLCLYAGLGVTSADAGLPKANLWVHPTADHDANWRRFAADPEAPMALYVSFPSAKDPTFESRFPGRSTVEILTFVPYEWFARWEQTRWAKRGVDYDAFKARFKERLIEALYQYVPGARGHIAWAELSTPLSTRHFVNQDHGEAYGLGHTPARFQLRSLGPRTPIAHLYLTGADVGLCGLMGALSGAALCASAVLRRNVFGELSRTPAR